MRVHNYPSMAAAFVLDGQIVLKKTYGVKKLGKSEKPNADTVYGIGSTSKAITAFGLMLLVDQGKIDLQKAVGNYLPKLPAAWLPINVINFLTHTSGLPDGGLREAKGENEWAQFADWAKLHPIQFKPGAKQLYSNVNFAVAGALIEQASGVQYANFMQKEVWGPLKMQHTGAWTDKLRGNMASPYQGARRKLANKGVNVSLYGIPSGGLVSTLDDMLAWEEGIRERRLLSPESYIAMFTWLVPQQGKTVWHFSPGWQIRKPGGVTVIAKNGSVQGYGSMIQMVPERKAALILLWNVQAKGGSMWQESATIWQKVFQIPTGQ